MKRSARANGVAAGIATRAVWCTFVALTLCGCGEDDAPVLPATATRAPLASATRTPTAAPTATPTFADSEAAVDRVAQSSVEVPGSVAPANPLSQIGTPANLNRGLAQVYNLPGVSDAQVTKVLVLVPGFLGGAGTFDYMARRVVLRSAGKTAVWAVDRRSNALEDQTGMDAAEAARDPDVAKDYYFHHASIGGKTFAGFAAGDAVSFESEWGIKTHIEDLDALISAALQRYPNAAVFLGGHSLGGAIVPIYAAWDFGDHVGFERLSGLILLEGSANPKGAGEIPDQQAYETTGLPNGTSLAAIRSTSPVTSLRPFVSSDLYLTSEIIAMRVSTRFGDPQAPTPDADLIRNFFRLLFGLPRIPVLTNRAALGFGFDDDFEPLAFARVSIGAAVGPLVQNPQTSLFAGFIVPGDVLLAPSDPSANYDWQPPNEMAEPDPTSMETFARMLFAGPSNFIEWYFPTRLTHDVGVTSSLDVLRSGDWRKDVYGMAVTENAHVDLPVFAVGGTRGLVRDVAAFDPYRASISVLLRNGMLRSAVPEGFVKISKTGYVHLDVLAATDTGAGNGIFGPLVEWMDTAVNLAPPPR